MRLLQQALVLFPLGASSVYGDILGPVYPAPRQVSSRGSLVSSGWHNIAAQLDRLTKGKSNSTESALVKGVTFSVGLFSIHDDGAKHLQYHHTGPETSNATHGVKKVDGDSIYGVASVSKLFTVFAGLLELEPEDWERPLTEVWPGFADFIEEKGHKFNKALDVQWNKITLSALAAQISGIPRTSIPSSPGDMLVNYELAKYLGQVTPEADPATYGLPPIDTNDTSLPPCLTEEVCTGELFTEGMADENPVFEPWSTPMYTNNGFILLGQAIANLSGKSIDDVYKENIFNPLDMKDSSSTRPKESDYSHHVIPGAPETALPADGIHKSSGGLYTTINDYAKFGVALLNSTLLPEERTRRWMKPVSHTSSLRYSVGAPWEIYRYTHTNGVVSDIYTKFGDSGVWSSFMILFPEFGVGVSLAGAAVDATPRGTAMTLVTDIVTQTLLPALMDQAALEAQRNFVGTYVSSKNGVESSLTLSIQHSPNAAPGLAVDSWTMNGTNVKKHMKSFGLSPQTKWVPAISSKGENDQTAFRPYTPTNKDVIDGPPTQRLFSSFYDVNDWLVVDAITYGGYSPINFVFDVEEGKATGVSIPGYRAKLKRQE